MVPTPITCKKVQQLPLGVIQKPCTTLCTVTTTATNSAWHSLHRKPGMVLKTQRIHTSGTGKSIPSNTVPFSTAIFSSGAEWSIRQYPHCSSRYWEKVNSSVYRNFLENKLLLYIEDVPLASGRQMWLWHDTAPPHFGRKVTEFLNEHFEGRYTARNIPVMWPA